MVEFKELHSSKDTQRRVWGQYRFIYRSIFSNYNFFFCFEDKMKKMMENNVTCTYRCQQIPFLEENNVTCTYRRQQIPFQPGV
jgi:hypothetical protein